MTSKKITVLHLTFNMALGGTEQVIRQLVENLDKNIYEAKILCLDDEIGELGKLLQDDGIAIECFKRQPGFDLNLIKAISAYIKQNKIDIVHCHQYTPYVYGVLASFFNKSKIVFTEHGRFYPDSFKLKRLLINPILSLITDAVIAISQATADALIKYENFPRKKVTVIYNGIRATNLQLSIESKKLLKTELGLLDSELVFGTISRLDTIKNHKMMIAAFAEVQETVPKIRLLIVGDGPIRRELEDQVKALNIEKKVIFTGFIVNPQPYLFIIDVFLLPSLSEGASMTLIEAMAFKKAVIVTDVGGNPEIVKHEITGLVTPNEDKLALVDAMVCLCEDPEKKLRFGEQGFIRYQQEFGEQKMVKQYQNLYQKCLNTKYGTN